MFVIGISGLDIFISLLYIIIIIFIAKRFKKGIKNKSIKRFFIPFIGFKIVCAILFVVLHSYVYRGGDTFLYFAGAKFISTQILHEPSRFFTFIFGDFNAFQQFSYTGETRVLYAFKDSATLLMSQITTIFYLFSFQQYLASTILISFFSAFGIWSLFSTMCKVYPKATKAFAIGILFYPSIGIWGSGILKDTIAITALGWMFSSFYLISGQKKYLKSVLIIFLMSFIILKLKPYILYTFLPAMLLWMQSNISNRIKSTLLKYIIAPIILIAFAFGGFFFMQTVSENAGKYSLENVQGIAEGFHNWHTYLAETQNQSGYTLGEVNFTPLGVLIKSPEAFFVTYFRPTPFEIRNFATAFESVQSTLLLLITLFVIFKTGIFRTLKITFSNGNVRAFLLFAIIMGVAVGITSYNFGALSRYKIPCLPFYTAALAIIYYEGIRLRNKKNPYKTKPASPISIK